MTLPPKVIDDLFTDEKELFFYNKSLQIKALIVNNANARPGPTIFSHYIDIKTLIKFPTFISGRILPAL